MPPIRVDFYLLSNEEQHGCAIVACRLLEKAYLKGHRAFVFCNTQQEAEHLDELLWTFKEDSFIPHHLQGEGPEPPPPIQIGWQSEPRGFNDILFNLSSTIPSFYQKFRRIIEIVSNDPQEKEQSREHYKQYKAQGYELYTHPIEG